MRADMVTRQKLNEAFPAWVISSTRQKIVGSVIQAAGKPIA